MVVCSRHWPKFNCIKSHDWSNWCLRIIWNNLSGTIWKNALCSYLFSNWFLKHFEETYEVTFLNNFSSDTSVHQSRLIGWSTLIQQFYLLLFTCTISSLHYLEEMIIISVISSSSSSSWLVLSTPHHEYSSIPYYLLDNTKLDEYTLHPDIDQSDTSHEWTKIT